MPVRSLNSSVLKWPSRKAVDRAIRSWTAEQVAGKPDLIRLGYFGSYARGDWGVGSDLDLIAIVKETSQPFERRALQWDLMGLPVPAEIIVYTLVGMGRSSTEGHQICPHAQPGDCLDVLNTKFSDADFHDARRFKNQ